MKRTSANSRRAPRVLLSLSLCRLIPSSAVPGEERGLSIDQFKSRAFQFRYGATVSHLPEGARLRVWFPAPRSGQYQQVQSLLRDLPVPGQTRIEPVYGNKMAYFEINSPPSGRVTFSSRYLIHRREVRSSDRHEEPVKLSERQRRQFLSANAMVPLDISEADKHPEQKEYYFGNLSENRVSLSTGRDIMLVPRQQGKPLNFFVYPYVEVDGKPWPADKISQHFGYLDMPAK